MRIDVVETNVYKFNELSDEAKQKAIESLYDTNVHYGWWDYQYEDFKSHMHSIGFAVKDIYFSGFSSQGDGACFEGLIFDLQLFLKAFLKGNTFRKIFNNHDLITIETNLRGHYCHSGCMIVNVNEYHFDCSQEYWNSFEEWVTEALRDLADDLYRSLEKEYDYLTSEEAIIESIESNDYEFTVDGKPYY